MGRLFIDQMNGDSIVSCVKCETPLSTSRNIESNNYQGSTGRASLFTKVVNLSYSGVQMREMMTGKHYVRDVYCKKCSTKLGWMYEFACPDEQMHKEGKVILERAFYRECSK